MIAATGVLLLAWLVLPRLRHRSAAERHALWAVALGIAALLPLATAWLPAWGPSWAPRLADAWTPASDFFQADGAPSVMVRATGVEGGPEWPITWVTVTWTAGFAYLLVRLLGSLAGLRRLRAGARPLVDERVCRVASQTADALGVSQALTLLTVRRTITPMTWGFYRATVLLPASALEWSDERLRVVMAHELGHVRRGDWVVGTCAHLICAVYWFHPLFWVVERRLRRDAECATDDRALGAGVPPDRYAEQLLAVVRTTRTPAAWAPSVAMARPGQQLERRVAALLADGANRGRASIRLTAVALASTAMLAVPAAAVTKRKPGGVLVNAARFESLAGLGPAAPAPRAIRGVRLRGALASAAQVVAPRIEEYTTPPLYSERARVSGVEGIVTVAVHVAASGQLSGAQVVRGLGFGLDENALVALRQWRFAPGTLAGSPSAMDVEVDVEFSIASEAVNELIANDMATLVGPGVTPPRMVSSANWAASDVGVRGAVVLDVVLLEDGTPRVVRILQSLAPRADELAVEHFEQWRFTPALKNGSPVKVRMSAEVQFHG